MKPSLEFFYEDNPVQRYEPAFTLGEHAQDNCTRGATLNIPAGCMRRSSAACLDTGGSSVDPTALHFFPHFFPFFIYYYTPEIGFKFRREASSVF